MDGELLSLKWNNHKSTFLQVVGNLRVKARYTDATLACNGKFYPVHRLVLSSCSEYFNDIFEHTTCKNPVIVLKDIDSKNLEYLLDYMYIGEVNVRQNELGSLVSAAECLQIKGLAVPDEDSKFNSSSNTSHKSKLHSTRSRSRSPPSKRKKTSKDSLRSSSTITLPNDKTSNEKLIPTVKLEPDPTDDSNSNNEEISSKTLESEDGDLDSQIVIEKQELIDEPEENSLVYDSEDHSWKGDEGFHSDLIDGMGIPINSEASCSTQQQDQQIFHSLRKRKNESSEHQPSLSTFFSGVPGLSSNLDAFISPYESVKDGDFSFSSPNDKTKSRLSTTFTDLNDNSEVDQDKRRGLLACPMCRFTCEKPSVLNSHVMNHKKEKRYKCTNCEYKTDDKSHLVRHFRKHTGERPFVCLYCSYKSSDSSTLKRHVQMKHLKRRSNV